MYTRWMLSEDKTWAGIEWNSYWAPPRSWSPGGTWAALANKVGLSLGACLRGVLVLEARCEAGCCETETCLAPVGVAEARRGSRAPGGGAGWPARRAVERWPRPASWRPPSPLPPPPSDSRHSEDTGVWRRAPESGHTAAARRASGRRAPGVGPAGGHGARDTSSRRDGESSAACELSTRTCRRPPRALHSALQSTRKLTLWRARGTTPIVREQCIFFPVPREGTHPNTKVASVPACASASNSKPLLFVPISLPGNLRAAFS